jgi:hypothetical protein
VNYCETVIFAFNHRQNGHSNVTTGHMTRLRLKLLQNLSDEMVVAVMIFGFGIFIATGISEIMKN